MSRRLPQGSDALTGDLFGRTPRAPLLLPGSMDFRKTVSALVGQVLKEAPGDRWDVAAAMSRLADVETSKGLLDSYTAESRDECNLPLWKAPVVEAATNRRDLAEWHASVLGGRVLWGEEILDADIGRAERELTHLQDQIKALKKYRRSAR